MHRENLSCHRIWSTLHMSVFISDLPHLRLGKWWKVKRIWSCIRDHSIIANDVSTIGRTIIAKVSACICPTSDQVRTCRWMNRSQIWRPLQCGYAGTSCSTLLLHRFWHMKFIYQCFAENSNSNLLLELISTDTGNYNRLQDVISGNDWSDYRPKTTWLDHASHAWCVHICTSASKPRRARARNSKPCAPAPSNISCTYHATFDDKTVLSPDFGPHESSLADFDGPPLMDVSALNITESTISIEIASTRSPTRSLMTPQRGERDFLSPRERKSERHRLSTRLNSSAISNDIGTYKDIPHLATLPSIPEHQNQSGGSAVAWMRSYRDRASFD